MEYRLLGSSGLRVPVLSLGTGTFGGTNEFFKRWGQTDVAEASRLIDVSLEHGLNLFDTAMSIRMVPQKRSWVLRSKANGSGRLLPRRVPLPWATVPTTGAHRVITCSANARRASSGWALT